MQRRTFLQTLAGSTALWIAPRLAAEESKGYARTLVLLELKGGNDGLNTVIPYADDEYYALRPKLAIARDQVLQLDQRTGLHPALEPMLPLWRDRQCAIVQGVGYPKPNLSHFRSIEIWDAGCASDEYLPDGWLARLFAAQPVAPSFAADGIVVGSAELGPLAGTGTRAIALQNTAQFMRQARSARERAVAGNPALEHILKVESDIALAAARLEADHVFTTEFPKHALGNALKTAAQIIAGRSNVAAIKVSHNGFDTHSNQPNQHARLLGEMAESLAAFRAALQEAGRWDSTLVMTYAEFGRRPRQNSSNGTDHGTASAHFLLGGKVAGGLYGEAPRLRALDGQGNLAFAVDFRSLYATVIERWWGFDAKSALGGKFAPLDVLRV
jgi:uncharacterized protein (DUF1501 family)